MKTFTYGLFVVLLFSMRAASSGEGSLDIPSTGVEAAQFYLVNQAGRDVVFYLETQSLARTEAQLKGGEGKLYSGSPGETWMNVFIYIVGQPPIEKYMESGKRYYLQATGSGAIDMFLLPPR
ncbi:hypothetical protein [Pseudomonas viridiflava]|uniref:hypothetical protein n=1 Tax=Pseudomonas viridiflava TaxID=33069 RepID=UPI000F05FBE5|nr:hypothetical protein [Pseudomonas viridiflava]